MALPSLLDEIDRLFDELIHRRWGAGTRQLVPTAMRETEDGWIIELPVEGLQAADLHVEVHGRRLTIMGYRRRQRTYRPGRAAWSHESSLQQTIALPADVDPGSAVATIEGDHLTIHIRKRQR
jgi:HSP20 family molecular chaperone IbpA